MSISKIRDKEVHSWIFKISVIQLYPQKKQYTPEFAWKDLKEQTWIVFLESRRK